MENLFNVERQCFTSAKHPTRRTLVAYYTSKRNLIKIQSKKPENAVKMIAKVAFLNEIERLNRNEEDKSAHKQIESESVYKNRVKL